MKDYSPLLHLVYRGLVFSESLIGSRIHGAQAIVRDAEGRILLVKPRYRPTWEFPGGKAERYEAPESAAVRETKEEARVFITKIDRKLGEYSHDYIRRKVTIHVYIASEWEELDLWRPTLEIAARNFFPPEELPADISIGTKRRINELLYGIDKEYVGQWI
jgi:8-oxo-dGTP pyrophosphatase MutT (NUDIX family)